MVNNKKDEFDQMLFEGSATGVSTANDYQDRIKAQMNANSQAWHSADKETQDSLHEQNKFLASLLGDSVTFDAGSGSWSGQADKPVQATQPTYENSYSQRIDAMLDQILNREPFSYDPNTDPLFQQLSESYTRNGQRAMQDTLGQVSARTGGMASSYAGTAAQQSYNDYMTQLNDKIPELYKLAYDMYIDEGDKQVRDYDLLLDREANEYDRYRDQVADSRYDQEWEYNVGRDEIADNRYDQEWEYKVGRDQVEDSRYESETAYDRAMDFLSMGIMPGNDVLTAAGMTPDQASAIIASLTKPSSGGGGGGGGDGKLPDYIAEAIAAVSDEGWSASKVQSMWLSGHDFSEYKDDVPALSRYYYNENASGIGAGGLPGYTTNSGYEELVGQLRDMAAQGAPKEHMRTVIEDSYIDPNYNPEEDDWWESSGGLITEAQRDELLRMFG